MAISQAEELRLLQAIEAARAAGDQEAELKALQALDAGQGPAQEAIDQAPGSVRMGLMDILNAPAQLLEKGVKAVAPGVAQWLNEKNNELADMGVPLQRLDVEGGVDKQVRDLEAAYQAKRAQEGETGVDWGRIGGNVGGTLAGGWAARALGAPMIPAAATTTGRLASGAALGAGAGVLTTPATDPTKGFGEEKLGQALAGGIGGAGGEAVLGGMRALGQAARRPDVAALRARGVEPTVGQTMGGMANKIEEKLGSVPLFGDSVNSMRQRAQNQFQLAANREGMRSIPGDVTEIGQAGVKQMQDLTGAAYRQAESLAPGGVLLNRPVGTNQLAGPGTQPLTAVQQIQQLQQGMRYATGDARRAFNNFMADKFGPRLGQAQGFDAVNFKELDSELGKAIAKSEGQAKGAFQELRNILRGTAADQNPAYAQALDAADQAYANLVRLEAAANRGSAKEGVVTPGQLALAAKYTDRSVRHRAAAAGEAPMQQIANLGQRVLGNTVADSGTPGRLMAAGVAGGAAMMDPTVLTAALTALAAGRGIYNPMVQRAMNATMRAMPAVPGGIGGILGGVSASPDMTR